MTQLDLFRSEPEPFIAGCTCTPGVRCERCRRVSRASLRMFSLCRIWGHDAHRDRVAYADQVTSMNDARAALCLAIGIDVDQIDPCTGHDRRAA